MTHGGLYMAASTLSTTWTMYNGYYPRYERLTFISLFFWQRSLLNLALKILLEILLNLHNNKCLLTFRSAYTFYNGEYDVKNKRLFQSLALCWCVTVNSSDFFTKKIRKQKSIASYCMKWEQVAFFNDHFSFFHTA